MSKVELVGSTTETVQRDQHRFRIQRCNLPELIFAVVRSPRWHIRLHIFIRFDDEINSECPGISWILCFEDFSLVVYWDILTLDNRPEGLQMAIEQ